MNINKSTYPKVMCIAGFDSSGGAGIQADIKTISALGCYASSVLTALPIQNTRGVSKIYEIELNAVKEQIVSVMEDIQPHVIKIGMVHSKELVEGIVQTLKEFDAVPIIFDPVMVATSGDKLINDDTIEYIIKELFPIANVITPNLDEAAVLIDETIASVDEMIAASKKIMNLGCQSILLKGGHLEGPEITSIYCDAENQIHYYHFEKFVTNNMHGSGCTLSSAIACYLARGETLLTAVAKAQDYVHLAIKNAVDIKVGEGNGPLNHFFNPEKMHKISI